MMNVHILIKFKVTIVSIWVNIQKHFKFLGHTVFEKNAMLTCKILKLFIRANCATLNF